MTRSAEEYARYLSGYRSAKAEIAEERWSIATARRYLDLTAGDPKMDALFQAYSDGFDEAVRHFIEKGEQCSSTS